MAASSKVALIMLLVRDVPRSQAFYTERLGFQVVSDFSSPAGDFIFLHSPAGGPNIALQDASKETYGVPIPAQRGGIILGLAVDDVDAFYRGWQEQGGQALSPVVDMGAGRMFSIQDPDGNYLQVYTLHPPVAQAQQQLGWT